MYNRTQLREILSGRRNGLGPSLLRTIAALGEPFYYAGAAWKNRRYDRDPQRAVCVGVPVISVGNITVGGTGKTPMVEWLARRLHESGMRVTLLSRGYGAKGGGANDEALELEQKLPGVPHLQNPDRVAAALLAIETLGAECLVLDDAFQHRRIARDLDLVLIDATEPFGCGHLLPRGLLRESLAGLRRADAIVLSRADAVSEADRDRIWDKIRKYAPNVPRIEAAHAPTTLLATDGAQEPLAALEGKRIAAFCGIGNPDAFRRTLAECGAEVIGFRAFADHHRYGAEDLESLAAWLDEVSPKSERGSGTTAVAMVVCTHKDLVKVAAEQLGGVPLRALGIGLKFLSGQSELEAMVDRAVAPHG